jgi:hypothetical protein
MMSTDHIATGPSRIRVIAVPLPPSRLVRDLAGQVRSLFADLVREPVPGQLVEILRRLR